MAEFFLFYLKFFSFHTLPKIINKNEFKAYMYKTHQLVNTRSVPLYFLQPFVMEEQKLTNKDVYVVVLFYPWFNLYFSFVLYMAMFDNEYKTKKNKN